MKVKDIINIIEEFAPLNLQEKWDNSGLLVNSNTETDKVLCCLDVTKAAVDKAVKEKCGIIVSHHPVIFSSIKSRTSFS